MLGGEGEGKVLPGESWQKAKVGSEPLQGAVYQVNIDVAVACSQGPGSVGVH